MAMQAVANEPRSEEEIKYFLTGSQAARKFSKRSNVMIKQTTLDPRNLKNTPDAYEEMALKRPANQRASTTPILEWIDGGRLLRTGMPIYYSEDCLTCDGIQKGPWTFQAIRERVFE